MPTRYAIVIERTDTSFSAFVPDLPECIAKGRNKTEVVSEMKDTFRFHIDGMMEDGILVAEPTSIAEWLKA